MIPFRHPNVLSHIWQLPLDCSLLIPHLLNMMGTCHYIYSSSPMFTFIHQYLFHSIPDMIMYSDLGFFSDPSHFWMRVASIYSSFPVQWKLSHVLCVELSISSHSFLTSVWNWPQYVHLLLYCCSHGMGSMLRFLFPSCTVTRMVWERTHYFASSHTVMSTVQDITIVSFTCWEWYRKISICGLIPHHIWNSMGEDWDSVFFYLEHNITYCLS